MRYHTLHTHGSVGGQTHGFPRGDILLDEREDLVTLVQREAVENVAEQQEWSAGRADPYTRVYDKSS